MIICFDTSAINRLLDDPDSNSLVSGITAALSTRISAFNVLEAAQTVSQSRRHALIGPMKRLAKRTRPLDFPAMILAGAARAHAAGESSMVVNAHRDLEGVWRALNGPQFVDDSARREAADWAREWMRDFESTVAGDREEFQRVRRLQPPDWPQTLSATIRSYLEPIDAIYEAFGLPFYRAHTGKVLTLEDFAALIREPIWPLYYVAYTYALHQRSIQSENYSAKRNAGVLDLTQSVYLSMCDKFVTNDRAQLRALRVINVFNTKRATEVLSFDTFRRRLTLPAS